jgi:hypothetical protein
LIGNQRKGLAVAMPFLDGQSKKMPSGHHMSSGHEIKKNLW